MVEFVCVAVCLVWTTRTPIGLVFWVYVSLGVLSYSYDFLLREGLVAFLLDSNFGERASLEAMSCSCTCGIGVCLLSVSHARLFSTAARTSMLMVNCTLLVQVVLSRQSAYPQTQMLRNFWVHFQIMVPTFTPGRRARD